MNKLTSAGGGLAGALALTLFHQLAKYAIPNAPRMDLLGMEATKKLYDVAGEKPPREEKVFAMTLIGDILSNALYYSMIGENGNRNRLLLKGAFLGLSAGLGAIALPKPLQLNPEHSGRTDQTKIMTVGLYLIGGLAAAATIHLLRDKTS